MTRWKLCSIAIGKLATGSLTAADRASPPSWIDARRTMRLASRALAAADPDALRAALASEVQIQAVDGSTRVLARDAAVEALLAWRTGWDSCEVLLAERMMAGRLLAATGFVVGIDRQGMPSCVDLHLLWN